MKIFKKLNRYGFSHFELMIAVVVLVGIAGAAFEVFTHADSVAFSYQSEINLSSADGVIRDGNYLYVDQGANLFEYDVSTPSAPHKIASYGNFNFEDGFGNGWIDPYYFDYSQNILFVASDNNYINAYQFHTNGSEPTGIFTFQAPEGSNITGLAGEGNTLYIALYHNGSPDTTYLNMYTYTSGYLKHLSRSIVDTSASTNWTGGGDANGSLVVSGDMLYLFTDKSNGSYLTGSVISVFNVSGNNFTLWHNVSTPLINNISADGNNLYVAYSNDANIDYYIFSSTAIDKGVTWHATVPSGYKSLGWFSEAVYYDPITNHIYTNGNMGYPNGSSNSFSTLNVINVLNKPVNITKPMTTVGTLVFKDSSEASAASLYVDNYNFSDPLMYLVTQNSSAGPGQVVNRVYIYSIN